ncbi:hypothetical protein HK101_007689, partial [Irineochytrium annulatum]
MDRPTDAVEPAEAVGAVTVKRKRGRPPKHQLQSPSRAAATSSSTPLAASGSPSNAASASGSTAPSPGAPRRSLRASISRVTFNEDVSVSFFDKDGGLDESARAVERVAASHAELTSEEEEDEDEDANGDDDEEGVDRKKRRGRGRPRGSRNKKLALAVSSHKLYGGSRSPSLSSPLPRPNGLLYHRGYPAPPEPPPEFEQMRKEDGGKPLVKLMREHAINCLLDKIEDIHEDRDQLVRDMFSLNHRRRTAASSKDKDKELLQ